jgi:membrane protein implicated in regulation of membrane protease activity
MGTGLAIIGLAIFVVWLAVGALVGFTAWFVGATFLLLALLFALRVDALTRQILQRRRSGRDGDHNERPGD